MTKNLKKQADNRKQMIMPQMSWKNTRWENRKRHN